MATAGETKTMLPVPEVTGVDVVFGGCGHMPKMSDIPEEFTRDRNDFVRAVSSWFFSGAKRDGSSLIIDGKRFTAKSGVDAGKALAAIRAVLGSFDPKHEHKEAACAYMLSEWFDLVPTT